MLGEADTFQRFSIYQMAPDAGIIPDGAVVPKKDFSGDLELELDIWSQ